MKSFFCYICMLVLTVFSVFFSPSASMAQQQVLPSEEAKEAYDKPNFLEPQELFDRAKKCLAENKLEDARLYALRLYFDGNRDINLINLLGMIEIQAGRGLLGSEWLRKACALTLNNKVAQRYLARLPEKPKPIPVDPARLTEHFSEIATNLPRLISRLSNPKLHFEAVLKALERGQIYLALALAEEYEKRYPKSVDGFGLSALCAWYLGRNGDALKVVDESIKKEPYNPILLFVKAMINDFHPATAGGSYFRALYDFDQWEKALDLVEHYGKQYPKSADAYITKARILLELHKTKEAGDALQEAGKREPGNPEIEMLWVNYMLQKDDKEKAARRLVNAFKRGYNLPSVNLTAAVFAIREGRIDEVDTILAEAVAGMPFSDPEAYPIYISLALTQDRLSDARKALNYWKPRSAEKSMYCYMEAFYWFKAGRTREAIEWLRKGFNKNPNRIDVLRFMVALPILQQTDPNLYAIINNKLSSLTQGFVSIKVPDKIVARPDQKKEVASGIAAVGAPVVSGNFKISLGADISENGRSMILNELSSMYGRIASRIGTTKEPINIKLVSAEKLGPMVVSYDSSSQLITVTTNYYDSEMLTNIVLANYNELGDEVEALVEEFPGHLLASALCRAMIQSIYPETKNALDRNSWLQVGLAEILAGSAKTQRYRLLVAMKSCETSAARLSSPSMLNSIFTEGYSSPAVSETAIAQSYTMVAYLIKKEGGLDSGCKKIIQLMKSLSSGSDLAKALKDVFKLNFNDFDKGWKEAAYWTMKNGAPYEWN